MLKIFINLTVLLLFISIFHCGCNGHNSNQDTTGVYLPEETPKKLIPSINITKCSGQTICNEVSNYPTDYIEKLLKQENITKFNHLFRSDIPVSIGTRFNIMSEGNSLCRSRKHLEKPKAGSNGKDNWFFLVNHGPFEQGIEVDVCEHEFKPCYMNDVLPFRTECRQKFIYRKMLAVDSKDGKMDLKTVKLPSCCSCHYFKK